MSFNDLQQIINSSDGTTRVINFWATWCKPCVDELPSFNKAVETYSDKKTTFIFVSVDFQSQQQKVQQKAAELQMKGTVVQLNEKGTDWIDEMDKNWSGAIPYTILIQPNGNRVYHYDAFSNYDELKNFLDNNLLN